MLIYQMAVVFALVLLWPVQSQSQEIPFISDGGGGKTVFSIEHQSDSAPSSNPELFIEEQKASLAIPLYNNQKGSTLSFLLRGSRTLVGEDLTFPDRDIEVPREFGTAETGFSWLSKSIDGDSLGFSATYGFAGRRLLDSGLTPIIAATLTLEKQSTDSRSWLFFLNYSNNRVLLNHVPIPGIAYLIKEKTRFFAIGVPFFFGMWQSDPVYFTLATSPLFVSGEASYRFWGPLLLSANAKWNPKSYQNLVEGSEERLIFDRKEVALNLKAFFGKYGNLSFGYAWNFNRRFLLGRSILDKDANSLSLDDSDGLRFSARLNF